MQSQLSTSSNQQTKQLESQTTMAPAPRKQPPTVANESPLESSRATVRMPTYSLESHQPQSSGFSMLPSINTAACSLTQSFVAAAISLLTSRLTLTTQINEQNGSRHGRSAFG